MHKNVERTESEPLKPLKLDQNRSLRKAMFWTIWASSRIRRGVKKWWRHMSVNGSCKG
jgi:hypothetical protein